MKSSHVSKFCKVSFPEPIHPYCTSKRGSGPILKNTMFGVLSRLAHASRHPKNNGNAIGAAWNCCSRMLFLFKMLVSHPGAAGRVWLPRGFEMKEKVVEAVRVAQRLDARGKARTVSFWCCSVTF